MTLTASGTSTTAVTASKVSAGTVSATITQPTGNLRMVGGTGLNIAHIGGKPVLLASKQQGLQGQVIRRQLACPKFLNRVYCVSHV